MLLSIIVRLIPEFIHEWISDKAVTVGERSHPCTNKGHPTVHDIEAALAAVNHPAAKITYK